MDWIRVSLELEWVITFFKRYWKFTLFEVFLGGVFAFLYNYFVGVFVQNLSEIGNYLFIVMIGSMLGYGFSQGFSGMIRTLSELEPLTRYYIFSRFIYYFIRRFFWDSFIIIFRFFAFFLIFLFLKSSVINIVLISLFFSLIVLFISYLYSFIFSPLLIYLRSEARYLIWLIEEAVRVIVPVYFLLSTFWFYRYSIFNPPSIVVEELRKLLIYGKLNISILLGALLVSFIYFIIGYFVFLKFFNIARKKGWVRLV